MGLAVTFLLSLTLFFSSAFLLLTLLLSLAFLLLTLLLSCAFLLLRSFLLLLTFFLLSALLFLRTFLLLGALTAQSLLALLRFPRGLSYSLLFGPTFIFAALLLATLLLATLLLGPLGSLSLTLYLRFSCACGVLFADTRSSFAGACLSLDLLFAPLRGCDYARPRRRP
jgi:hypothetical protein